MTDEPHIIQRVLDGDTESFRLLVERYAGPVVGMIRNVTGDARDCEDLAQDVFLAAFARLRTFDPARSRFSTWLLTIARNMSINLLRKGARGFPSNPRKPPDDEGPLECVTRQRSFTRLDARLRSLPDRQRRRLTLVEFEDCRMRSRGDRRDTNRPSSQGSAAPRPPSAKYCGPVTRMTNDARRALSRMGAAA